MEEFEYDLDAELGIPSDMTQKAMLGEAIYKANRIHQELSGMANGMLADYVRFTLEEASEAAAALLTMHPKSERELFELQKRAAPYASVVDWIRKTLSVGQDARQQLDEETRQMENLDGTE